MSNDFLDPVTVDRLLRGITDSDIQIGRLKKRIAKLQDQRDHYKQEYLKYKEVFSELPYIECRIRRLRELQMEYYELRELRERVKEQAKLIELLQCQKQ
jgi:predicted RNase H-like nuclease (RuvC/YqgF family)